MRSSRRMIAACRGANPAPAAFGSAPLSSRNSTSSVKPPWAASAVALTPQASVSLTLAPAPTSSLADSRSPERAANISAVSRP